MNSHNLVNDVLDEIALEGLEGITLQTLWIRLQKRQNTAICFEDGLNKVKKEVWSVLIDKDICDGRWQFLQLPEARPDFVYYDRFEHVDPDHGMYRENSDLIPIDIYSFYAFEEGDIRGSCFNYHSRKDVSDKFFQKKPSLENTEKDYGNTLVILASQEERHKSLGVDHYVDISARVYSYLEMVGRMRHLGLVTFGAESAPVVSKTAFYYRKVLKKAGLIQQSPFFRWHTQTSITSKGLLVFLPRFFQKRYTPLERSALRLSEYLARQPNHESEWLPMREHVEISRRLMTNLLAQYSQNFEVFMREYKVEGETTTTKFISMKKPVELDEYDEEEAEANAEVSSHGLRNTQSNFDPLKILADRPLSSQVCTLIETCPNKEGYSMTEISEILGLSYYEIRTCLRSLLRQEAIRVRKETHGKTKLCKYYPIEQTDDPLEVEALSHGLSYDSRNDTVELIERAVIILGILDSSRRGVVVGLHEYHRQIREKEQSKGITQVCDIKTIARLLVRLRDDGKVNLHKFTRVQGNRSYEMTVTTKPGIRAEDPIIKDAIEEWMLNVTAAKKSTTTTKPGIETRVDTSFNREGTSSSFSYKPSFGKKYGVLPKIRKIFAFYRFLLQQFKYKKFEKETYTDWRKHISPMDFIDGRMCTLAQLIPRVPLFIFCQVVNLPYIIPGLEEALNDEELRNSPLSVLDKEIVEGLLYRKKYLFAFLSMLSYLTDMGLTELDIKTSAPREEARIKLKNVLKFFVNDDSTNRSKRKKPVKVYKLESVEDVNELEEDLFRHSSNPCNGCSLPTTMFVHTSRNWTFISRPPVMTDIMVAEVLDQGSEKTPIVVHYPNKSSKKIRGKLRIVNLGLEVSDDPIAWPKKRKSPRKRALTDTQPKASGSGESTAKRRRVDDDKDRQAKSLMTKLRCSWSQQEDQILLLCRVASLLLDPTYHLNICVPLKIVRDVLHEWIPASRDKTVRALQRRLVFLLKNGKTNDIVQDWVSELKQDENFADIKRPEVAKTNEDVWKTEYLKVLNLVLSKFVDTQGFQAEFISADLPENINISQYTLVDSADITSSRPTNKLYADPNNVVDIHVSVVNNVLLSSLLSQLTEGDNESRAAFSHALFRIYRKYPDTLIRSVVAALKKSNAIANIKSSKNSKSTAMKHNGITPYKVSAQYKYLLQTKLSMDSLIPTLNTIQDYKLGEFTGRSTAALASSVLTTRSGHFSITIPNDFIQLNEGSPYLKSGSGSSLQLDNRSNSRSILYAMRENLTAKNQKDYNNKVQDILNIGQCSLVLKMKEPVVPNDKFHTQLQELMQNYSPSKSSITDHDIQVIKFIQSKKELGVSWEELQKMSRISMAKLKTLVSKNVLYRVGVDSFRWVHRDFITPWVVNSYDSASTSSETTQERPAKKHQIEKPVQYLAKVWRRPTGEVDLNTLFSFMSGIIGFLVNNPGVKKDAILGHFSICAPATQLLEVLELLDSAGCIITTEIPVQPKLRLFSSRFPANSQSGHQPQMETFYEASASSLLILSHIRAQMEV